MNIKDFNKLKKGDFVLSNSTYRDLKRKDGSGFDCVIRNDDILYIIDIDFKNKFLLVELREDILNKKENREFLYGPFIINISQLQDYENIIKLKNLFDSSNKKMYSELKFKEGRITENRINILKTIKSFNELDFRGVSNITNLNLGIVESGILFLLKNKLITPTGGGYFKLNEFGEGYLNFLLND